MIRRLLTNGALVLMSLAAAALLSECALATFRPQDRSVWAHRRDGLVVHPSNIDVYLPGFGQSVRTNAWGMRDLDRTLEKPPGVFRILLLGDSFMEALQVSFDESFPSRLEELLTEATGRPIEVINAGVSGWGTDDELTYLARSGLQFEPDLVFIAMTLHNDVNDNLALEYHDFRGGRIEERPVVEASDTEFAVQRVKDWVANSVHVYQIVRNLRRVHASRAGAKQLDDHLVTLIRKRPDARTEAGWEMTDQLLDKAVRIARERGARTAVMLLPLRVQVEPDAMRRLLAAHGLEPSEIDPDQPQRRMVSWGAQRGIPVFDTLPVFRAWADDGGSPLYVERDGHWTAAGHALAAKFAAGAMLERNLLE